MNITANKQANMLIQVTGNDFSFKKKDENSEIDFRVDFELKNKILNMLMTKSFDIGLKKIADAFEKRAIELFKNS